MIVVGLRRLQGLRSLLGLAVSLFLVVKFVVPAILNGSPALLVALVGSMAVMLVTMVLSHGTGLKSAAAILATTVALLLTALLALLAVGAAHITGLSSEESVILTLGQTGISIEGLVLAGMVIGALGVLDDVTVSQASTQIVAGLVGSTGLIAAVPLTTALAALLAVPLPRWAVPDEHHGHQH